MREITDEARVQIRKVAERMVQGAGLDEPKHEEALEYTIGVLERMYQEGHDIYPPEPSSVRYLEWRDGKWNLETDWLDKKWEDNERFLVRRK